MRLLVAEDETLIRLDLVGLLERAGHDVCAQAVDGLRSRANAASSARKSIERAKGLLMAREGLTERIVAERALPIVIEARFDELATLRGELASLQE